MAGFREQDPDGSPREPDVYRNAWQHTLDDMEAMADELEADGWEVVTIPAGDTAPEHPDVGDSDRFGLVHVVPGNKADDLAELVDGREFPTYDVYRATFQRRVFLVTALFDEDAKCAIMIAGTYERKHARQLIETAREEGVMYTHVQRIDKTPVARFEHTDVEKFFPETE